MSAQQAFVIPFAPQVDITPSLSGWSIWAPTELDRHLQLPLPEDSWGCYRYPHFSDDVNIETLLAECRWAEEWDDCIQLE